MSNYFSKNLKFLRKSRGLSQNKLADKVGVNQTTIARWENEEIIPSIDNVEQIANALNINLPDILIEDLELKNNITAKNEIQEIKDKINNSKEFTLEGKQQLNGMIDYYHSINKDDKNKE